MYNDKLFRSASKVSSILNGTPIKSIECAAFRSHNYMPTARDLFKYSSLGMTIIEKFTTLPSTINYINIIKSK